MLSALLPESHKCCITSCMISAISAFLVDVKMLKAISSYYLRKSRSHHRFICTESPLS